MVRLGMQIIWQAASALLAGLVSQRRLQSTRSKYWLKTLKSWTSRHERAPRAKLA